MLTATASGALLGEVDDLRALKLDDPLADGAHRVPGFGDDCPVELLPEQLGHAAAFAGRGSGMRQRGRFDRVAFNFSVIQGRGIARRDLIVCALHPVKSPQLCRLSYRPIMSSYSMSSELSMTTFLGVCCRVCCRERSSKFGDRHCKAIGEGRPASRTVRAARRYLFTMALDLRPAGSMSHVWNTHGSPAFRPGPLAQIGTCDGVPIVGR